MGWILVIAGITFGIRLSSLLRRPKEYLWIHDAQKLLRDIYPFLDYLDAERLIALIHGSDTGPSINLDDLRDRVYRGFLPFDPVNPPQKVLSNRFVRSITMLFAVLNLILWIFVIYYLVTGTWPPFSEAVGVASTIWTFGQVIASFFHSRPSVSGTL